LDQTHVYNPYLQISIIQARGPSVNPLKQNTCKFKGTYMAFKFIAALPACLLSTALCAQVYTWKDASGHTNYGDAPPAGVSAQPVRGKLLPTGQDTGGAQTADASSSAPSASASSPAKSKSWEEQDRDFKQRKIQQQEAEAKAKKEQEDKAAKDLYCSQQRNQLTGFQQGGRYVRTNEGGQREYLTEDQIKAEAARVAADISSRCK
jgi:hypothetical protein